METLLWVHGTETEMPLFSALVLLPINLSLGTAMTLPFLNWGMESQADHMKYPWDSTSSVEESLKTLGRYRVLRFKVVTFLKLRIVYSLIIV